jgi:hypothetical protein
VPSQIRNPSTDRLNHADARVTHARAGAVRRPSRHQERDMKYILAIFIGFLLILFGIFGGLLDLIF